MKNNSLIRYSKEVYDMNANKYCVILWIFSKKTHSQEHREFVCTEVL